MTISIRIEVRNGLIFLGDNIVDAKAADRIASANGLTYAERFCKEYDGKSLELDEYTLKITTP